MLQTLPLILSAHGLLVPCHPLLRQRPQTRLSLLHLRSPVSLGLCPYPLPSCHLRPLGLKPLLLRSIFLHRCLTLVESSSKWLPPVQSLVGFFVEMRPPCRRPSRL